MRPAPAVAAAAAAALLGAGLAACFDVLHATGDLRTACEVDGATPGCTDANPTPADGGPSASVCAPSREAARASAEHACAWLSACETPLGGNAIGPCVFAARMAFDCAANQQHPARGKRAAAWRCLAEAKTCSDVDACIFPAGVRTCGAERGYVCGTSPGAVGDVRLECSDGGGARAEDCALWGQTCVDGACAATNAHGCARTDCSGSTIDWCDGKWNVGIDCAAFGSARCDGFPAEDAATWVACVPDADGGAPCDPSTRATCASGAATSCPAGVSETIDCAALLGTDPDAGGCKEQSLSPPFDWTSACGVDPPVCSADGCDGGVASGCARGTVFSVDCVRAGLGPCSMRSTDMGTQQHAACTAPPAP